MIYLYIYLAALTGFILGYFACSMFVGGERREDEELEYMGVDLAPESDVSHVAVAMYDENNVLQILPLSSEENFVAPLNSEVNDEY